MSGTNYASEVSHEQLEILGKLLPAARLRGRPPLDRRWVLNAILYVLWTGCPCVADRSRTYRSSWERGP